MRFCTYTYWAHNPLNSRGINGKRTEHQNGRGVPLEGHPTPIVVMTYIIKNLEVKGLALKLRGTPGISLVLWWFSIQTNKASKKIFAFMKVKGKGGLIWFFRKSLASASDERIQAQWAEDKQRRRLLKSSATRTVPSNDISNGATRRTKLPRRCWLRHG